MLPRTVGSLGGSIPRQLIRIDQEYIEHLQNRIFELEAEVSAAAQEEDDGVYPEERCTIPNCSCPYHKNQGPPSSPSLPPPTHATKAYYGEGATQYASWPHY